MEKERASGSYDAALHFLSSPLQDTAGEVPNPTSARS